MPSRFRLEGHFKGSPDFPIPEGWGPPERIPFMSDPKFGVPYTPMNSAGRPLANVSTDNMFWYIFQQ